MILTWNCASARTGTGGSNSVFVAPGEAARQKMSKAIANAAFQPHRYSAEAIITHPSTGTRLPHPPRTRSESDTWASNFPGTKTSKQGVTVRTRHPAAPSQSFCCFPRPILLCLGSTLTSTKIIQGSSSSGTRHMSPMLNSRRRFPQTTSSCHRPILTDIKNKGHVSSMAIRSFPLPLRN